MGVDPTGPSGSDRDEPGHDEPGREGRGRRPRRTDTADPRRARERALKILFQADVRDVAVDTVLDRLRHDASARAMLDDTDDLSEAEALAAQARADAAADTTDRPAQRAPGLDGFTRTLVLGVAEHRGEIDALIARYARRWQIHRMPAVDRSVLRLATFELLHESTPAAVVIDEAVNLAKGLSTDDSGRYVNGVLESIRKDVAGRQRPGV